MNLDQLKKLMPLGVVFVFLVALSLTGCDAVTGGDDDSSSNKDDGGDDSGSGDDGDDGEEVMVLAVSGESVSLEGTWSWCYTGDDGFDRLESQTFEGLVFRYELFKYSSQDASCDGDEESDPDETPIEADVEVGDDVELVAWAVSGPDVGEAPIASDEETEIADPPSGTPLTLSTEDEPDLGTTVRLVDDTGDDWLMYRDNSEPEDPCAQVDGVPQCLFAEDPLTLESDDDESEDDESEDDD